MTSRRVVTRILLTIAIVLALGWVVDSVIAMRVEKSLAQTISAMEPEQPQPRVYVGGLPYVAGALTKSVPRVSVDFTDYTIDRYGEVNVSTTVQNLKVTPDQIWSGDFDGAETKLIQRSVRMDGVALGKVLHMPDISLANPSDISPSASPAVEVDITGTPEGFDAPVTVRAELRVRGDVLTMTPRTDDPVLMKAFSWSAKTAEFPHLGDVNRLIVSGGSLSIDSEIRNSTFRTVMLSGLPLD